jgi:AhpD family alkylhydroperoxidase
MEARLDYYTVAPDAVQALYGLETYLAGGGLGKPLLDLVKLRASQLNACAFCIDLHSRHLRKGGEDERRLYLLTAWRESPGYTDRERAALAWTDAVTHLADGHVSDEVFAAVRPHFSDKELADLTLAVATINAWNRMCISFRAVPGTTPTVPKNSKPEKVGTRDARAVA